jgi:hypothetical protein
VNQPLKEEKKDFFPSETTTTTDNGSLVSRLNDMNHRHDDDDTKLLKPKGAIKGELTK